MTEWTCSVCARPAQHPENLNNTLSPDVRVGYCPKCGQRQLFRAKAQPAAEARRAATEQAMTAATAAAPDLFKREFLKAVHYAAERNAYLTTDEVWARLSDLGVAIPTETRGVGTLMRTAAKYGWIRKTDRKRPSVRATTSKGGTHHATDVNVWASNLHVVAEVAS